MRGKCREELRFRSRFQTVVKWFTCNGDLFNHLPQLIHLDWKNAEVGPAILMLSDRLPERAIQPFDTVAEQILKPNEQRELEAAVAGFANHSHHVDTHALLAKRRDGDVSCTVDGEIPHAPSIDVVCRDGVPDCPFSLFRFYWCELDPLRLGYVFH